MSADGEIDIAVKAEGVDEAAAELGEGGGGGGGGGGDRGGGGLRQAIGGGIVGGLLSQVAGPLLDVLSPMLKILQAFLAPLAMVMLRLLAPVLRFLLPLLPAWMDFIDNLPGHVQGVIDWVRALPGNIWDFMTDLPGMIWEATAIGGSWLFNTLTTVGTSIGSAVWAWTKQGFDAIVDWLQGILDAVGGTASDVFSGDPSTPAGAFGLGFGAVFDPSGIGRFAAGELFGGGGGDGNQTRSDDRTRIDLGFVDDALELLTVKEARGP